MATYNVSDFFRPTAKQAEALKYIGKGYRIFWGGSRGGGKSKGCMGFALLASLQFKGLHTVLIRQTYGELEDNFISKFQTEFPSEVFSYTYRDKTKTIYFKNGSQVKFRACETEKDAKKIQGIEFQLMIIDEANNFDEQTIHKLSGSLRTTKKMQEFVPTLIMTGNPGGSSDLYFKTRFISPDYKMWQNYELKHRDKYIFIPAKIEDNPYVTEDYADWLDGLPDALRKAWKDGDWSVYEGAFLEEWKEDVHIIAPFAIPENWTKKVGFDLGWTKKHPAVALWVAQNPKTLDLYVYREYHQAGVTEQYADEIAEISQDEIIDEWWADPAMFNRSDKGRYDDDSPEFFFLRKGITLQRANNDRMLGWRVVKQWLHWDEKHRPKIFFFDVCDLLIATAPLMRYNKDSRGKKEDMDTKLQDDAWDALRYVLLSGFTYPTPEELEDIEKMYDEKYISEEYKYSSTKSYEEEVYVSDKAYYL